MIGILDLYWILANFYFGFTVGIDANMEFIGILSEFIGLFCGFPSKSMSIGIVGYFLDFWICRMAEQENVPPNGDSSRQPPPMALTDPRGPQSAPQPRQDYRRHREELMGRLIALMNWIDGPKFEQANVFQLKERLDRLRSIYASLSKAHTVAMTAEANEDVRLAMATEFNDFEENHIDASVKLEHRIYGLAYQMQQATQQANEIEFNLLSRKYELNWTLINHM